MRTSASTASTVTLAWDGVSDAVSYEILRDDRAIASTDSTSIEVPRGGENRFFVRAVDAAGNRSATTAVYVPLADGQVDPCHPVVPAGRRRHVELPSREQRRSRGLDPGLVRRFSVGERRSTPSDTATLASPPC